MRRLGVDKNELKRLYIDDEFSVPEVAEKMGLGTWTVSRNLRRYGLSLGRSALAKRTIRKKGHYGCFGLKSEQSPRWSGGRKHTGGYVRIYQPDHPRTYHDGYVLEHIVVWEKAHGQLLPEKLVIHHLNGVKDDNRPENLVAMTASGHSRREMAEAYKKRIRQLEGIVVELLKSAQGGFNDNG